MTDKPDFRPESILASPAKRELTDAITEARYRHAVETWLEYYRASELRDRAYPHSPGYKGDKGVLPIDPFHRFGRSNPGVRDLVAERDRKLQGLDAGENNAARVCAGQLHERELKPCDCYICKGAR